MQERDRLGVATAEAQESSDGLRHFAEATSQQLDASLLFVAQRPRDDFEERHEKQRRGDAQSDQHFERDVCVERELLERVASGA